MQSSQSLINIDIVMIKYEFSLIFKLIYCCNRLYLSSWFCNIINFYKTTLTIKEIGIKTFIEVIKRKIKANWIKILTFNKIINLSNLWLRIYLTNQNLNIFNMSKSFSIQTHKIMKMSKVIVKFTINFYFDLYLLISKFS